MVNCCQSPNQKIHAVCAKKDVEFESKLSRVSLYSSDIPKKCWQCNFPFKSELFCQVCKTLQEPPEKLDYFKILGIDKSFNVNNKEIHDKYRQLQNILHPDRFGNKSEKEREYSENLSALLNKAYTTLSNPLKRGIYLLELNNITISEGTTSLEPEFLMEIMERNEEVEEATDNKDKLLTLTAETNKILTELSKQISNAFDHGDIERARMMIIRMKYYNTLNERLKKTKYNLGIAE
ncbi:hypothetical protein PV325_002663 [Microctonus aethiopoides]|nr:hypothetical protein PV325_002663 [Microctonus aethiopoides]